MAKPGSIQPAPQNIFGLYNRTYYGVPAPRFNPYPSTAFSNTRQPSAGAGRYAYDSLGLAEFTFIGGGVVPSRSIKALQPKPLAAIFGITSTGLGGLVAGTMALQPLQDNPWSTAEPVI